MLIAMKEITLFYIGAAIMVGGLGSVFVLGNDFIKVVMVFLGTITVMYFKFVYEVITTHG